MSFYASLPNFKAIAFVDEELLAKEVETFLLTYMGKWAGGHSNHNFDIVKFMKLTF